MTDPAAYPRRILLAVTGLSPQIVTETLYALAVAGKPPWVPTEIRIITTRRGAKEARRTLISDDPGWFWRLCADYRLAEIAFGAKDIRVITGPDGEPLDDILDEADNAAVADFITEEVRELTADPKASLHVSIAGGRKTMGFYLGYALSLFGRTQDRLSHVLVPTTFESRDDIFYPRSEEFWVHLGDIPFVRLRAELPERLLERCTRFSDAVAEAQKALPPAALGLDPVTRTVTAGGATIALKPAEFAFYLMLAERRKRRLPGAHWSDKGLQIEILECYARVISPYSGDYARFERAGMSKDSFNARKSHINAALVRALGKRRAESYLVEALAPPTGKGQRRLRPYGLRIRPEAITITPASLPVRRAHPADSK
jgi:CRISPR-associated protein (TIGR02584 family)